MKKYRNIKPIIICSCGAIAMGILGFRYSFFSAEAEQALDLSTETFYVRGASVRLVNDEFGPGVKFHVVMDKSVYDSLPMGTETGTVVIPESLLSEGESLTLENERVETRVTTDSWFLNEEGKMESVVYIYDIPPEYYGQNIAVAGYVNLDGAKTYSASAAVSMAWVANEEYNDTESVNYQNEGLKEYFTFSLSYDDGELQPITYGDKLTAPQQPEATDEYSWFAGWTNKDGILLWDFENDSVTGNIKLYSKFERVEKPKLSMQKDGEGLLIQWQEQNGAENYSVTVNEATPMEVAGVSYRLENYDADRDYRITVTANKEGVRSQSTTLFLDHRTYRYDSDYEAYPIALFDSLQYADTMEQVYFEPTGLELSDAGFEVTTSGFKVSANGSSAAPNKKSGFTYRFPFALSEEAKLLSFKLTFSAWGISQYSNAYVGLVDSDGKVYNVSSFVRLKGNDSSFTVSNGYISHYNQLTPIFIVNLADFYKENPTVRKIVGLSFGQNKKTDIKVNYITYSNVLGRLSEPTISTAYGESGATVSWNIVENADNYEVLLDGERYSGYTGGTSFVLNASGLISVQAKSNSADYGDSSVAKVFVDASFLKKRDDNTVWLSDFNHSSVLAASSSHSIGLWEDTTSTMNLGYSNKGITFKSSGGDYAAVKYSLPKKTALSEMNRLVISISSDSWTVASTGMFFMLSMGDTRINVTKYMSYSSGSSTESENMKEIGGGWLSVGYGGGVCVSLDVQTLLADNSVSLTEIDGIIIGTNNTSVTYCLEEVYFYLMNKGI